MDAKEPLSSSNSSVTAAPATPDVITKAVHENIVRQRTSNKKQVVYQTCHVCNIELAGQAVIESHMAGSKHAKKLRAQELLASVAGAPQEKSAPFRCEACDVNLNSSTQLEVHCAGAKHRNKVGSKKGEETNTAEESGASTTPASTLSPSLPAGPLPVPVGTTDQANTKPIADLLHCAICNVHVNSSSQLEQHLSSKKHRERESGRKPQRTSPYPRPTTRGGRGGLGSHGRGGKALSAQFTSLSNSFKSAGYSNTFIKPEGGVIMPKNSSSNNGNITTPSSIHSSTNQLSSSRGPPRNKGNFGSLSPYVNSDNQFYGMNARGGFNTRGGGGGGYPRGGWHGGNVGYGPQGPCGSYGDYGYDYSGYDNYGGYNDYNMMHAGPSSY